MNKSWFFSKTKAKILLLFFQNPNQELHMRALSRATDEHINAVREALLFFQKIGVLLSSKNGKKIFYRPNPHYLFFDELLRMVAKQTGLGERLLKEKTHLGKIERAFFSESFYHHLPKQKDEVVVLLVGVVPLPEIEKIFKEEGEKIGEEINYALFSPAEYATAKKNKDPFLNLFFQKNHLVLIGKQ